MENKYADILKDGQVGYKGGIPFVKGFYFNSHIDDNMPVVYIGKDARFQKALIGIKFPIN